MILKNLEPYVKNYLQKEWSDYWDVSYNEKEDKIECIWNGMNSTKIEFSYDSEDENLLFVSKEPQPVGDLVEMLSFLNDKAYEIFNELVNKKEAKEEMER